MLKYLKFFNRLAKERYWIASSKKYLFLPLFIFFAVAFLFFVVFGSSGFAVGPLPLLILLAPIFVRYRRFWKIFGYHSAVYWIFILLSLFLLFLLGDCIHPLVRSVFSFL